jgi:hypothetical protein
MENERNQRPQAECFSCAGVSAAHKKIKFLCGLCASAVNNYLLSGLFVFAVNNFL